MSAANFSPESVRDDDDSRTVRVKVRNNFNYVTLALNAAQDAFKKSIQAVQDSIIKPALRGGFAVNDIRYYGTLANAVAAIPTASIQTVFITTPIAVTANLTIPSNISLVVMKGGTLALSGGVTLTINGPFESQGQALADMFSGAGAFLFGKALRITGAGSPEAAVTAPIGSEYLRNNGGADTTLYIKESGTGNTGWKAIPGTGAVSGAGANTQVTLWSGTSTLTGSANLVFSASKLQVGGSAAEITLGINTTDTGPFLVDVAQSGSATPATKGTGFGRNLVLSAGASDNSSAKQGGDLYLRAGAPTSPSTVYGDVYIADSGGNTLVGGDLKVTTVGKGLYIKEGSNATMGRSTLVAGTVTVSTTKVTANSEIYTSCQTVGGTPGFLRVSARSAGTSFTILSSNLADTSVCSWLILEPA